MVCYRSGGCSMDGLENEMILLELIMHSRSISSERGVV
jgi:hypothetical protein